MDEGEQVDEGEHYDVFLSHSSVDKPAVEAVAERLKAQEGLRPFLDKWDLTPGVPWQEELAEALAQSDSVAVFIGPSGSGPWHNEELRLALDRAARSHDEFRVIPVLLPGADPKAVDPFLAQRTWVAFAGGLSDEEAMRRLVAGVRGEVFAAEGFELPDEPAPYKGLFRFEREDGWLFFGREDDTKAVLDKLERSAFVAVLGASGSGKSSLVRAGVIPRLTKTPGQDWRVFMCTPGTDPCRSLAEQVATLAPEGGSRIAEVDAVCARIAGSDQGLATSLSAYTAGDNRPTLLLVDQFEELFTLGVGTEDERRARQARVVANLTTLTNDPAGRVKVVITMRADFLGTALAVDGLSALLQDSQVMLGPIVGERRREVIVQPAKAVGALFEKGLVSTIMADVEAQPGALPLLQHALHELWTNRRGPWLTIDAYEASGGVVGALATSADAVYGALPAEQQALARQVFVRLTTLGDGVPDTRRRVQRSELYPKGAAPADVDAVLDALSSKDARLIVIDGDTVEVAHEALLRSWPTLRTWLDANRDSLRVHRRLSERANEWAFERNREPESLYEGSLLTEASTFAAEHGDLLNDVEGEFVAASQARASAELDEARRHAARLRRRLIAASVACVVAVIAAAVAVANQIAAQDLADAANARAMATAAEQQAARDPGLAALLALESYDLDPTPEATRALHAAISAGWWSSIPTREAVIAADVSQDGARVVTADEGVTVWGADGTELQSFPVESISYVRLSPDGSRVAITGYEEGSFSATTTVWDVETGERGASMAVTALPTLPDTIPVDSSPRWMPDGEHIVAIVGADVATLDAGTGARTDGFTPGPSPRSLAVSPDGARVAVSTADGLEVWDLASGSKVWTGSPASIGSVTFVGDGSHLAATGDAAAGFEGSPFGAGSGSVWLWTIEEGVPTAGAPTAMFGEGVLALAASTDGRRLVTTAFDGVHLWDLPSQVEIGTLPYRNFSGGGELTTAIDEDGSSVVVIDGVGTRVWNPYPDLLATPAVGAQAIPPPPIGFDGTGARAVRSGGGLEVWDVGAEQVLTRIDSPAGSSAYDASMSADGSRTVAVGFGSWAVWDAASGEQLASIDEGEFRAAALDGDGSRAVVVGASGAQVLDVDSGEVLATFAEDSDVARDAYDAALDDAGERALVWGQSGALLFDLESGQEVAELGRTDRAAFDHGGSRFATVSGGEISIRDADGQLLVAIPKDGVNSQPAFSHDDALLYIGVGDGVELYDVESGLLLGTVPTGQVTDAVPDETGERLTVAAADATLHVWRSWDVDAMREELVARLDGRELSETECELYDVPGC